MNISIIGYDFNMFWERTRLKADVSDQVMGSCASNKLTDGQTPTGARQNGPLKNCDTKDLKEWGGSLY